MANPTISAADARAAIECLLEQERILTFDHPFTATDALVLGSYAAGLRNDYNEGYCIEIWRESDGADLFRWLADDKADRNYMFAAGKRRSALVSGHASPYEQLDAIAQGRSLDDVWAKVPHSVASCGAFPIRAEGTWVATIAVSGLHEGLDHDVVLRALEHATGRSAPRLPVPVA